MMQKPLTFRCIDHMKVPEFDDSRNSFYEVIDNAVE